MEERPSYREIAILCTVILAFCAWFAAELGVPYGRWTHWPRDLQALELVVAGSGPGWRGIAGMIAAVILVVGLLMSRTLEKDDPALEKRPPRWLFVLFCLAIWAGGVWIISHWWLASPPPGPDYDWAAEKAARATASNIKTIVSLLAAAGLVIHWLIMPRLRK